MSESYPGESPRHRQARELAIERDRQRAADEAEAQRQEARRQRAAARRQEVAPQPAPAPKRAKHLAWRDLPSDQLHQFALNKETL